MSFLSTQVPSENAIQIFPPELRNNTISFIESSSLVTMVIVSKAWFEMIKNQLIERQIRPLSLSKEIRGKFILANFSNVWLSVDVTTKHVILKLNSKSTINDGFEDYTLVLNEGKPISIDFYTPHGLQFVENDFFATIQKSLSTAKITEDKKMEITGLEKYIILPRCVSS